MCSDEVGANRSLVTAELPKGRYYVYSDSFSRAQSGDYVLSMERETPPPQGTSVASVCAAADVSPLLPGEYEIDTLYAPSVLSEAAAEKGRPSDSFI